MNKRILDFLAGMIFGIMVGAVMAVILYNTDVWKVIP